MPCAVSSAPGGGPVSGPVLIGDLIPEVMEGIASRVAERRRAEDLLDQIDLARERIEALTRELAFPVEEN